MCAQFTHIYEGIAVCTVVKKYVHAISSNYLRSSSAIRNSHDTTITSIWQVSVGILSRLAQSRQQNSDQ